MLQTLRKLVLIIVGVLVLYALCGFLILPALLQAKLPGLIQQETGRKASVEKVSINPFSLEFKLAGFSIQDSDAQPFIGFDVLAANLNGLDSIWHWAPVIDEVRLDKPAIRIARSEAGTFNFADLFKQQETPEQEASKGIFPFLIRHLTISEGSCVWEDRHLKRPEQETIAPIDLSVSELSTLGSEPGSLHLSLVLSSGGRLDWTGNAVMEPLQSKGSIRLDQISLPKLWKLFLQDSVPFKLKDGVAMIVAEYEFGYREGGAKLTLSEAKMGIDKLKLAENKQAGIPDVAVQGVTIAADYSIEHDGQATKVGISGGQLGITDIRVAGTLNTPGIPDMKLQGLKIGADTQLEYNDQGLTFAVNQGKIDLNRFSLSEQNQQNPLIAIPKVAVNGIKVDSAKQQFDVSSIDTEDASIKAWLDASGAINYQSLFASPSPEPAAAAKQDEAKTPWKIRLDKVSVKNYRVNFTDQTQQQPVVVDLAGLTIGLDNYSNEQGANTQLQLRTRVNDAGAIKITGEAALSPLSAELAVDVNEIGLKTAQPYLEKYVRLEIVNGDLSTQGQLSVALAEPDRLSLNYQGNANIANLLTRDKLQHKDFVKWSNLELGKISIDLQHQIFGLENVVFEKPYVRIIIKKDSTTNIHDILIAQEPEQKAATAPESAESKQKSPTFSIGKIRVKQGLSDYADYSLILPFITQMDSLDGTLIGLSSAKDATAKLSLTGKVYDLASVDIAGQYQIDTGDSAFKLAFRNMPLPLVTPYMAEFAGYKIEKGQMSLDLSYTVNNGQLKAENKMFIDQFTLGEKVESPKAVSLPLNLAIALLKDPNGNINLDLPISGSLEDPEFSVSALVFKALGNLITKIVTSPFHALASLVGGGQDLSVVSFSPGSAELDMAEKVKLSELAEALKSRPSLRLDIKGASYQEQDWEAMRSDALKDQLKKMKAKELKAEGSKIRSEYVELSEEDYKRLLAQLFIEKFPLLAEYSFFGKPQLKNPEAGNFYEVARQKLESIILPEQQRLETLAMLRASNIAKFIIGQGGIASDRVFILAPELDPAAGKEGIVANLSLDASH